MDSVQQVTDFKITFTDDALSEMKKFSDAEGVDYFRISVMPGGCSGFKYSFDLIDNPEVDDVVIIQSNGVKAVIDPFSASYLNGVSVEYVSNMMGSGFKFNNPNSTGGCGCGTSFSA